jgi:hypothetical protein
LPIRTKSIFQKGGSNGRGGRGRETRRKIEEQKKEVKGKKILKKQN